MKLRERQNDLAEFLNVALLTARLKAMCSIMKQIEKKKGKVMFKIELGAKVKDNITGFRGIVTGRCEYITGCRQYLVTTKGKPDKRGDSEWFDEDRLHNGKSENNGGAQEYEAPIK